MADEDRRHRKWALQALACVRRQVRLAEEGRVAASADAVACLVRQETAICVVDDAASKWIVHVRATHDGQRRLPVKVEEGHA